MAEIGAAVHGAVCAHHNDLHPHHARLVGSRHRNACVGEDKGQPDYAVVAAAIQSAAHVPRAIRRPTSLLCLPAVYSNRIHSPVCQAQICHSQLHNYDEIVYGGHIFTHHPCDIVLIAVAAGDADVAV